MEMDIITSQQNLQEKRASLNILSRPDGSVIFSQGETTVLAGCYGPIEAKSQKILTDKVCVEVYYRPKSGIPSIGDRSYEAIIKNVCEVALVTSLYPRTSIMIVLQEMQNCGGLISCAINAACAALLDAGVDMKFLIGAVSCAINEDNIIKLEPPALEWENSKAGFLFVFDSFEGRIVASHTTGSFSVNQFKEALKTCRDASGAVFKYFRDKIKESVMTNDLKTD
ncbi:exosome complex component RRP46 [Onthophagus taurus]|uniref:exosome complex component RRP46 n=1 Tax=Onthophagus taurus TaxID=166361 RepID=UPI0039BE6D3D